MRNTFLIVSLSVALFIIVQNRSARAASTEEPVERLTLHAVATTQPSVQFKLLPELIEQTPGNAATLYLMAFKLGPQAKEASDAMNRLDDYLDAPAEQLPRDKAAELLSPFSARLRMADLAAHRSEAQWDSSLREEGFAALLPYLNDARGLNNLWSLQARLQILNNDWRAAARTIADGFSLAGQINQQPVLIDGLVAAGITQANLSRSVQDWITHGDSPNLYWSLSGLPQPFIDIHQIAQWEKATIYYTFPALKDASFDGNPDRWHEFLLQLSRLKSSDLSVSPRTFKTELQTALLAAMAYPRAQKYLLSIGRTRDQIDAMSVDQTVGIYFAEEYRRRSDEEWKAWELPFWEGGKLLHWSKPESRRSKCRSIIRWRTSCRYLAGPDISSPESIGRSRCFGLSKPSGIFPLAMRDVPPTRSRRSPICRSRSIRFAASRSDTSGMGKL